ncbi:hypothetical protein QE422_003781 [Chryseobacterium sp. SORGH_AS 447]|nr:hypothetical protein [Chryseobacterium sp. SORGH_AS_0447]MDQ1163413.1 hypothetical protein [Chryseobacterium sp. SORGH_AS_0447]
MESRPAISIATRNLTDVVFHERHIIALPLAAHVDRAEYLADPMESTWIS